MSAHLVASNSSINNETKMRGSAAHTKDTTNTTKHSQSNRNGSSGMGGGVSIDAYQNNF